MKRILLAALAASIIAAAPALAQWPGYTRGGGGGGGSSATAASPYGADNRVIRSDGTGRGTQPTGISVDDSNNVSGVADISAATGTFSGNVTAANLAAGGTMTNGHVCRVDTSTNPDTINCNAQVPGIPLYFRNGLHAAPADSTTYYITTHGVVLTTADIVCIKPARSGTITAIYATVTNAGTLSTTEQGTLFVRFGGANTNISTAVQTDQVTQHYSNTGLSIAVTASNTACVQIGFTTPAWATNPTNVIIEGTIFLQP